MTAIEAPLQSHVIKMDDRKRPSPYDQHDGPPSKKIAAAGNGSTKAHPDADMPWKDDIEVRFALRISSQHSASDGDTNLP